MSLFGFFTTLTPKDSGPWTWSYGPSPAEIAAANAVVVAARAYADFTHGNLTGPRYHARQEARDALLDALEAFDDVPRPAPDVE